MIRIGKEIFGDDDLTHHLNCTNKEVLLKRNVEIIKYLGNTVVTINAGEHTGLGNIVTSSHHFHLFYARMMPMLCLLRTSGAKVHVYRNCKRNQFLWQ
mmetsp:Transcript_21077/g.25907  ORF Transcript_21077/g.25907 Transcript_21077/m.25907 type:complete len:98 (+) Transcript_21077:16-309(+)